MAFIFPILKVVSEYLYLNSSMITSKNTLKGRFRPKNPSKYKGDPRNIIFRSSWERKLMAFLDSHPDIVRWSSEELVIPYLSPIDNKIHRYFPDFVVEKRNKLGQTEMLVIEIKPSSQTKPPKKSRNTKRMITEAMTYEVNKAKWEQAQKFCDSKGWKFIIFTEKELGIKKNAINKRN